MKRRKERKLNSRFLAGLLSALMILTLIPVEQVHAATGDSGWTGVANGEILVKDTVTPITDGVTQHEVITNVPTGDLQHIDYIAEIKMGDTVKIAAGYGRNDASSWSLTPTTTQAKAYEAAHPGETVVAAINADFFNMANGQPMGALVMEGKICNEANGRNYFGITKDGKAVIRNSADLSDLQVAVGGDVILVKDGQVCYDSGEYGALKYSRTAIGIKADGTVMTFVTYGLRAPISCGRTYTEIAEMMQAAGCVMAIALDGGGSSTYCSRPEGTDKLVVSNSPADGAERAVSSSLLVVSTAEATGVFDHAALSPNNELYTPGTTINFSANGVDTAGMPMDLPAGTTWALSSGSEAMGTIDAATGVLTVGENCGTIGVDLLLNGEVVGSTTVEIVVPDSIYFANEEISLGFEQVTDFGLVVRNKNRDIHIKAGDIVWNLPDERMGTFDGNAFTSADGVTLNGNVTATSKWDESVSGSIHVIVGMLPTIVWDFEDQVDEETGEVISAKEYYTGKKGILTHSNYDRGGNESIEIVTIDDDEPVRFGKSALKLNYDFRNCGAVTEGACVGTSVGMTVPGVPTGIGVWVYAPEGVGITYEGDGTQAGFWLRGYVRDGNGSNQPYDFVLEPKACKDENGNWNGVQPGISWEGWKYLEADLTKLAAPYSIQPGMTFRLMYVAGTQMGTKTANSIYFDNLQFVYGANVDDIDAPVVDAITVNGKTLTDGDVLTDDKLNVSAIFHDVQNKYTSGIDKDTVRMYVDDVNVVDNSRYQFALQPDGTMCYLYDLELEDGPHTITVFLRDEFGNDVTETRTFTVKKTAAATTTVRVAPLEETAVIGKTVSLEILASDATVTQSTTVLRLGNLFPDYQVTFADGYEGTSSFSKSSGKLTIKANRKADTAANTAGETLIATVSVAIPTTLSSSALFTYGVKGGCFETDSGYYASYFQPDASLPVSAEYTVSAPPIIAGEAGKGTLTVTNSAGEPAVGVSVYLVENNELIGVTDENGQLTTDRFSKNAGKYLIYAKDDAGLLSFQYNVASYNLTEQALPYGVRFNSPVDEMTQKDISWISNVAAQGQQSIRYAVSGTEDWTEIAANTTQFAFDQGGYITANFNNICLTGLKAGTTYKYQVGSGDAWTEVATFSTSDGETDHADFFVLGDIQADDLTNITTIRNILKDGHWNFGLQTGDAVDNPYSYKGWEEYASLINGETMGSTNMVQVLGNHELQGEALQSKVMFGLDSSSGGSHYSRTFGNVYLAVINYTSNAAQLRAALDWLKTDAQASDADWKILSMHQPAYYTNETGGNAEINALVPDAVEEAGIDVVFSGHDHSLARTNPLRDDEVDEENGILYYICGSSGEKSYSITTRDRFDYDKIFALATLDFNAVYFTAHADRDSLTINAFDVNNGLMDTYTLKSECAKHGHSPVYDAAEKKLTCTVCGREIENFTGDVKDAEGNSFYLLAGVMQTGWVTLGEDVRYYNPGTGIQEELTVFEKPSTCIIDGYIEYTSASGAFKHIDYTDAGGHDYEIQADGSAVCSACGHVRVNMTDATVTLSYTDCTYTGKARTPATTAVAPDGTVLTKSGSYRDYYSVYSNNVEVGTAAVTLHACKYGYYVDINDWRGNCKGTVTVNYVIHPDLPTNVECVVENDQVVLSWIAALSAPEYVIYASTDGKNYEPIGTTTDTSYTVSLEDVAGCTLRIGTQKIGSDGKLYSSLHQTNGILISPTVSGSIKEETGKPALSWSKVENADYYQVFRAEEASSPELYYQTPYLSYTNTAAEAGHTYSYMVRVVYKDGSMSEFSPEVTLTAQCAKVKASISQNADGKPVLSWNAAKGADTYQIYRNVGEDGVFELLTSVKSLSYTDNAVDEGQQYSYCVVAVSENGVKGAQSEPVFIVAPVLRPVVEAGNNPASGKPTLKWSPVEGAVSYQVYRSTAKNGNYAKVFTTTGTTYTHISSVEGKTYYYKVVAVFADGATHESDVVSADCRKAPFEVAAYTKASGKPALKWTTVEGAESYQVYRSTTEDGKYTKVFTTAGTTYTHVSAQEGKTYYYKVVVVFYDGTTYTGQIVSADCREAELAVEAYTKESGKPALKWTAVEGATSYQVYRSTTEDGKYVKVFTTTGTTYTHISASVDNSYFYKVKAVFGDNSEVFSQVVSNTCICGRPEVQTGNRDADGLPTLKWKTVDGAAKYYVYRATTENGNYVRVFTTTGTTYTHISAKPDTVYFYKVVAVSDQGNMGAESLILSGSVR